MSPVTDSQTAPRVARRRGTAARPESGVSERDVWAATRALIKARRSGSCVAEFHGEGRRPPLFFLPGRDGVAAPFYQYTAHLGADQPFYFLEPPQLELDRPQPQLFRDLAERYLEEIRPIHSHGPYLLAGYCSGGAIAYEMALALERQGEEVGTLILIDTVVPTHARWSRLVRNIASPIRRRLAGEIPRSWPTRKLSLRSAVRGPWRRWGWRLPRPLHYDSFEDAVFDQRGYDPEPYGGRVVLIRSDLARRMARPGWGVDADLGWGRVVAGGVAVRDIPGTHWDFRHQPEAVRAVALELRRSLDEALGATASSGAD